MFEVEATDENVSARLKELGIPGPHSPNLGVLVTSRVTMFLRGAMMRVDDIADWQEKPAAIIFMANTNPVQFIKEA